MHSVALLTLSLAVSWAQECGVPDRSHPPSVKIEGGKITGLTHGIHGGNEAVPNSFPWMVSLGTCGASIVNKQWVVTAAHCVADNEGKLLSSTINLALGTHQRAPVSKHDWIESNKIIVHPQYRGACNGKGYDIALIKLPFPVKFTDRVQPICLPSKDDDFKTDGEKIIAMGWGSTDKEEKVVPNTLQQALFETSATVCKNTYIRRGHSNPDTEFCAFGGVGTKITICAGDSGGPQVAYRRGRYTLAGVNSCGVCAGTQNPAILTHVPSYVDWINQHINDVDPGEGKDVNAAPSCRDNWHACEKYKGDCGSDATIRRDCPKTCGVCQ